MGWPGGRKCSVRGCGRNYYAKGFCRSHYYSTITNPGRKRKSCSVLKCYNPIQSKGLCATHYRALPEVLARVRICTKCKRSYTGFTCKVCHAKRESNRRARFNPQERAAHLLKLREWGSNFRKTLSKRPLEKQVYYWAKRVLKRASKGGRYQSRSVIPLDTLVTLALKGLERFPYMNFSSTRGVDKIADRASLDRVSPKIQYEVGNIRVVPLWLNMAKCDLTDGEFTLRLKKYIAQKKGVLV